MTEVSEVNEELLSLRDEIDKIDSELIRLFKDRFVVSEKIANYKIKAGKAIYDPEREKVKLDRVSSLGEDEFEKEALSELFAKIMELSRKKQQQIKEV